MLHTEFEIFDSLLQTLGDIEHRFSKKGFLGDKASSVFQRAEECPHVYAHIEGIKPILISHFKNELDIFERKLVNNCPIHNLEPLGRFDLIDELIDIALNGIGSGETSFAELDLYTERNPYRAALKLISWSLPLSIQYLDCD